MSALGLLRVTQHQAALLTLVLVLHGLHKPLFVASLLGDEDGRAGGAAVGVQLQRGVGRQGAGGVQLLTRLHFRKEKFCGGKTTVLSETLTRHPVQGEETQLSGWESAGAPWGFPV